MKMRHLLRLLLKMVLERLLRPHLPRIQTRPVSPRLLHQNQVPLLRLNNRNRMVMAHMIPMAIMRSTIHNIMATTTRNSSSNSIKLSPHNLLPRKAQTHHLHHLPPNNLLLIPISLYEIKNVWQVWTLFSQLIRVFGSFINMLHRFQQSIPR